MKSEGKSPESGDKKPKKRGKLSQAFIKAFVKEQFGRESKEDQEKTPFDSLEEEHQLEMIYEVQSLVAERKDLVRSISRYEGKEEEKGPQEIKIIKVLAGGRRIRVPRKVEGKSKPQRKQAIENAKTRLEEIKEKIKTMGETPGFRDAYEKKIIKMYYLARIARKHEELVNSISELQLEIDDIVQEGLDSEEGAVIGAQKDHLQVLEEKLNELQEKIGLMDEYEGGLEMQRFLTIKKYASAMEKGRIVEFPSAEKVVNEALDNMRRHQPFLFAGHLGSGKTEMARHTAKLFMIENGVDYDPETEDDFDALYQKLEPEFFSGGDEASIYDLVGKLKLVGKSSEDKKLLKKSDQH